MIKFFVTLLMSTMIFTNSAYALSFKSFKSIAIIKQVSTFLKRQVPTEIEKYFLSSGRKISYQGRDVIQRDAVFNPHHVDAFGKTNIERMKQGKAPIGNDGIEVHLHHYQQRNNGPIMELTATEHRGHFGELHRYTRESEIDRAEFNIWKSQYWKHRAKDFS